MLIPTMISGIQYNSLTSPSIYQTETFYNYMLISLLLIAV